MSLRAPTSNLTHCNKVGRFGHSVIHISYFPLCVFILIYWSKTYSLVLKATQNHSTVHYSIQHISLWRCHCNNSKILRDLNTISCSWAYRSAVALLGSDGVSWVWIQAVPVLRYAQCFFLIAGLVAQLGLFLRQVTKLQQQEKLFKVFSASSCIKFINILLPDTNHMAQPKVSRVRRDIPPYSTVRLCRVTCSRFKHNPISGEGR